MSSVISHQPSTDEVSSLNPNRPNTPLPSRNTSNAAASVEARLASLETQRASITQDGADRKAVTWWTDFFARHYHIPPLITQCRVGRSARARVARNEACVDHTGRRGIEQRQWLPKTDQFP